jgi:hypothetical protein
VGDHEQRSPNRREKIVVLGRRFISDEREELASDKKWRGEEP